MNLNLLQEMVVMSIVLSTFTCIIIQKTKKIFKKSYALMIYSLIVNMILGILFANSFANIKFPNSLWIGLFSFLGADTIYKSLEGKLLRLKDIKK